MGTTDLVETKSAFARRCNVSPGRVTQWIDEGKLSGSALVGEGRSAKIRVEVGLRQVSLRRDAGQAAGNGLGTKLAQPSAPTAASADIAVPSPQRQAPRGLTPGEATVDQLDVELKRERLWKSQAERRDLERKEALEQGRLVEAVAVRRQQVAIVTDVMRSFEGALPEIASAIASRFQCEERLVLQLLGREFRKVRERSAEKADRAAGLLPATIPDPGPTSEPDDT